MTSDYEQYSLSDDKNELLTQPNTDSQVTGDTILFSQSYAIIVLQYDGETNAFTNDNFVDKEVADTSDASDDDESFLSEDDESSAASVDLSCDEDVSAEPIYEIPESGRMTKKMEDYDLENIILRN